ncbi:MAG: amino acid ABC transporter substrate-binding protein [Thermodesulfobacteriota bacterium]
MRKEKIGLLTRSGRSGMVLMLALMLMMAGWAMPTQGMAASEKAPEKIRIGNAISMSGPYAAGAITTQANPYDMWVKEVNAQGGIYLKAYNKKVPVEMIRYDDKSDMGTVVKLVEKLILSDKVDLLLPPWSTAMNFAIAPIVTKHKYPVLGVTVDSMKLKEMAPSIPYMFIVLNQPPVKAEAIVPLCKELGVKTAAVVHHTDLHGIEFAGYVTPQLSVNGIDVVLYKSYPLGAKDLSPLLKKVKSENVDAFFAFSYPPETFLLTQQAKAVEFNPKLFYTSIGTAFAAYRDAMGVKMVEGVMGTGAWNPKVPHPGAKEFWERMVQFVGPGKVDWYGNAFAYSSVQILQQAVEKVGSLDRKKIRDAIAKGTFPTVIGPVRFESQINVQSPGEVGQWQNGAFEIVAAKAKRTAQPIYPKPPWP